MRQLAHYGSQLIRPATGGAVHPERLVRVTERLYQVYVEHAHVRLRDTIALEDGTLDIHPDLRFAPGEAAPID